MTARRIHRFGNSRGQSLIEFGLCVFLLVMLLIGVVEIGRMVLVYTTIANAARTGTRYAEVHGTDNSFATLTAVKGVVTNYLGAAPMTTANATVHVCYAAAPGSSVCTADSGTGVGAAIGSEVTISVSYLYDPFTTYFPLSVTLSSTSQGVITF